MSIKEETVERQAKELKKRKDFIDLYWWFKINGDGFRIRDGYRREHHARGRSRRQKQLAGLQLRRFPRHQRIRRIQ
jgi:hypothetical protein